MKKIFIMGLFMLIFNAFPASAANGDVIRPIYSTDILTYMDGIPIKGYAINGKMMICVEDLREYGYTVTYDDSIRSLFANKTSVPNIDTQPTIERDSVGEIIGYTYETDIKVYINGIKTNAENIGGKMVVVAEDISDTIAQNNHGYNPYSKWGVSEYFLSHEYYDDIRTLYINSNVDEIPSYDEQLENFLSGKMSFYANGPTIGKPQIISRKDTTEYTLILYKWEWITSIAKFYKNGISMDMYDVITHYRFQNQMHTTIDNGIFSENDNICYVNGSRYKRDGIMSYALIDKGIYTIDTDTFIIKYKGEQ